MFSFYGVSSDEQFQYSIEHLKFSHHLIFAKSFLNWMSFCRSSFTNLVGDVVFSLPVKFCQILFSGLRGESKMSQPKRGRAGHLGFLIRRKKNTNLVEDDVFSLTFKFRKTLFSGFREIENVSSNQKSGQPSWFSEWPEKEKLTRGRCVLASSKVSLISVQQFQRKSRKCLSQPEVGEAIFVFRSARKSQTWQSLTKVLVTWWSFGPAPYKLLPVRIFFGGPNFFDNSIYSTNLLHASRKGTS